MTTKPRLKTATPHRVAMAVVLQKDGTVKRFPVRVPVR